MRSPATTVAGPSLSSDRLARPVMLVSAVSVLSDGFASAVMAVTVRDVLQAGARLHGAIDGHDECRRRLVAGSEGAHVQVTVPPRRMQPGPAQAKVTPVGRVSTMVTPAASDGPGVVDGQGVGDRSPALAVAVGRLDEGQVGAQRRPRYDRGGVAGACRSIDARRVGVDVGRGQGGPLDRRIRHPDGLAGRQDGEWVAAPAPQLIGAAGLGIESRAAPGPRRASR